MERKLATSVFPSYFFWEIDTKKLYLDNSLFIIPRVVKVGTLDDVVKLFNLYPISDFNTVLSPEWKADMDERDKSLIRFFLKCLYER